MTTPEISPLGGRCQGDGHATTITGVRVKIKPASPASAEPQDPRVAGTPGRCYDPLRPGRGRREVVVNRSSERGRRYELRRWRKARAPRRPAGQANAVP